MPLHPTGTTAAAPIVALAVLPTGERSVMYWQSGKSREGNRMHASQIDVKCPICGTVIRLNKMGRHRNRRHPETSPAKMEALMIDAYQANPDTVSTKRVTSDTIIQSATHAMMKQKKHHSIRKIFSGGLPSLGKKR